MLLSLSLISLGIFVCVCVQGGLIHINNPLFVMSRFCWFGFLDVDGTKQWKSSYPPPKKHWIYLKKELFFTLLANYEEDVHDCTVG